MFFFFFFKSFAISALHILVEYRNRQQQPGYAAEMRRLIWAFVVRTRKKNHFVNTWQIHKYNLPLSCLGSFMDAIECSVRFASCIRYTNKSIIYVVVVFWFFLLLLFCCCCCCCCCCCFCIVIFSCSLLVTQINQKSLDSRHCQTSQASRKLFYFPVYYFSPYQNTVTSVVDWLRLALIPEMAVNTWHPGNFLAPLTIMNTGIEYPC